KAARLVGPRRFEFEEAPMPSLKQGEVLVKMEYFSVCGSDLRTYDRVFPEEEYPLRLGGPCHECVGVVEESRDDRLKPGQRVIALQAGGLLEYAAVPARNAVVVPEGDSDAAMWVLCQPVGTVLYATQQIGTILGKRVVILGQGPIGLSFTDFVVRGGARQVIVADLHDYRLEVARRLGATHTVNASRESVVEAVREITGGELADVSIEACGRPETAHQAFECLKMQGTAIIFGIAHDEDVFEFDWNAMTSKLPRMVVTNSARSGDMPDTVAATVDLVSQGRLSLEHLLTHRMGWEDVGRAYEMYSGKQDNSLKIVMSA
ncbi:MAG TPA: zinc-binding dehydrogenase, partial [Dehalococcoidia bacterium]|nr:zinc-binding dehydrogenase [Dehalococcoidia bacterium]